MFTHILYSSWVTVHVFTCSFTLYLFHICLTSHFQQDSHPSKYDHCLVWCGLLRVSPTAKNLQFLFYHCCVNSNLSNVRIQQKSKHTADTQPTGLTAGPRSCVYSVRHPWVSSFQECLIAWWMGLLDNLLHVQSYVWIIPWSVLGISVSQAVVVINGGVSLWDRGGLKLRPRQQLGSDSGPVGALRAPRSPINQTQIKGLSGRVMFNQKDTVAQSINHFLFSVFSFPNNQENEGETIISGLRGQRGFHSYIGVRVKTSLSS